MAEVLERDAGLAHLAGKLHCARHYIAGVLPGVDGQLAGLAWNEPSVHSISDASL
jgi:hypothetical protein